MLFAPTPAPFPPPPSLLARIHLVLMRMAEYGHDIIKGLHRNGAAAAETSQQTPETEQTQRDITKVMPFFARGVLWAISLAQALAGDLIVATRPRAPKPAPQPNPQPQPAEAKPTPTPKPPADPAEPPAPNLNHMRRVFATRPIGYIVAHICADLCILDDDPDYPYDLLDITQTIADYTAALPPSQPAPLLMDRRWWNGGIERDSGGFGGTIRGLLQNSARGE